MCIPEVLIRPYSFSVVFIWRPNCHIIFILGLDGELWKSKRSGFVQRICSILKWKNVGWELFFVFFPIFHIHIISITIFWSCAKLWRVQEPKPYCRKNSGNFHKLEEDEIWKKTLVKLRQLIICYILSNKNFNYLHQGNVKNVGFWSHNFFNCYLAAPRPTLGHSQGDSLTNSMLFTAIN